MENVKNIYRIKIQRPGYPADPLETIAKDERTAIRNLVFRKYKRDRDMPTERKLLEAADIYEYGDYNVLYTAVSHVDLYDTDQDPEWPNIGKDTDIQDALREPWDEVPPVEEDDDDDDDKEDDGVEDYKDED